MFRLGSTGGGVSEKFDAYKDLFRHADSHDATHNPLLRVDIDETLMDTHLPLIPSLSPLTARSLEHRNTKPLSRQGDGTHHFYAGFLSDGLKFPADLLQLLIVRAG